MIQRIQTIWFILAAACTFATFKCAFFSGSIDTFTPAKDFNASNYVPITILTSVIGVLGLVLIFLYGNRKLQLQLTIANLIASLLLIALYFWQIGIFVSGAITIFAIFTFAIPLFLFLAARSIWKDQRLVRSVDRLR
ncbi:MAG: DUF4293 family protein [Chitinophagaceae bacterium]|nr:DUF4293 family protein [Chitinophagaceae bacterium]